MKIAIINGPNLNLLGKREVEIYGEESFEMFFDRLRALYPKIDFYYFQSNNEGALTDKIQELGFSHDGIILNGGGLTHTSVSMADAISLIPAEVVEVHISNIHAREEFRHHSYFSRVCKAVIVGAGMDGYRLAVEYFLGKK